MSDSNRPLALPANANLRWLKNRAADRLRELRLADPGAKRATALRDVARSYGLPSWAKLKSAVEQSMTARYLKRFRDAVNDRDASKVERLLREHVAVRTEINAPMFAFDSPAIVAAGGNRAVVDALLRYGADINQKSAWWAGGFGVLDNTGPETADFLMSRGAKVDIFAAAGLDRIDLVRQMLRADPALVHARGGDGGTPLHFARSIAMIDLLLDSGADIDVRDRDHEGTPAQWMMPGIPGSSRAFERGSIDRVRHLVSRGAAVDVFMAAALDNAEQLARWIESDPRTLHHHVGDAAIPLCPKAPGEHQYVYSLVAGTTVIDVAAGFGSTRCLDLIRDCATPVERFVIACALGDRYTVETMLRSTPTIASSLTQDDRRRLPAAAWAGRVEAVTLMLDAGFNPLCVSPEQGTALHAAAWHGRADIVAAVLEHPATRTHLSDVIKATEPTHNATAMGWCCHGSLHCRNPAGDYAETARLLMRAGAERPADLSQVSGEIRALLESIK